MREDALANHAGDFGKENSRRDEPRLRRRGPSVRCGFSRVWSTAASCAMATSAASAGVLWIDGYDSNSMRDRMSIATASRACRWERKSTRAIEKQRYAGANSRSSKGLIASGERKALTTSEFEIGAIVAG